MFESVAQHDGRRTNCAEVLGQVQALCRSLEPDLIDPASVDPLFASLVAMRRLVDGAITRLGPRYERSGAWQDRGAASPAAAIAKATGSSPADAKRRLDAGRRLAQHRQLDDALRTGAVSTDQATVIARAAVDDRSEASLIDTARSCDHQSLRAEAARVRASADHDDAARHERQRRLRSARRWTDEDGMYNLHLRTLPEVGAVIDARLAPVIDRVFERARREGRREEIPAYAADAVAELLTEAGTERAKTSGQAVRPQRKVIALVDIASLQRGRAEPGETCELAGVGPVSVAAVRALFGDAATTVVFRDAVDVRSVVHLGRQVTAHQRTALEARGAVCGLEGCGSTHQLEIDHCTGWTYTHTTSTHDLDWLCSTHHAFKTRRNLLAIGPPGQRVLVERDPVQPTVARDRRPQERRAPARAPA